MGFWGVSNILLFTGLGIIAFFAFSSAQEDNRTDIREFFKLSGILISLAVLCVIFIDVAFLTIQAVSWLAVYFFSVLKNDIFTVYNGYLLTLLLVNAGGAYMVWELRKERAEEEKFKEEAALSNTQEMEAPQVETNNDEVTLQKEPASPATEETLKADVAKPSEVADNGKAEKENLVDVVEYALLKELDISQRIAKTLHDAGIDTISDLTDNSIDQLKNMKNLGEKSLEEIQGALEKVGLSLKAV